MTCSHWKSQMTTPSSSPRFSGQADQITIDGRPVPLQSGVLHDDFVQRLDALKKASGLTWNGFAQALGVDRRQVNRWREGTEPCGGARRLLEFLSRHGTVLLVGPVDVGKSFAQALRGPQAGQQVGALIALIMKGGLSILLGGKVEKAQDYQLSLWEE